MHARQVVITEPYKLEVREMELPPPSANQILVATEVSAVSAGTELAVWTGTHQWLKDPTMPEWKFPFRPGYSGAGRVVAVGSAITGWQPGDRVSYAGNHASAELLNVGPDPNSPPGVNVRAGGPWRLPEGMDAEKAAWACIARYGMGAAIRAGITLGRSATVLGLGIIGQFALRSLLASGSRPVVGIDGVRMRRQAALLAGADAALDPAAGPLPQQLARALGVSGAEIVADATGLPDAVPTAMSLACDGGQVVIVGSPRGQAKEVNFYDHLHRRYLEVTGAHGNMLFEPAHTRLAGAWNLDKAQYWLLHGLRTGRLSYAGLVTQRIDATELGAAYEGLLKKKEEYLGVVVQWK